MSILPFLGTRDLGNGLPGALVHRSGPQRAVDAKQPRHKLSRMAADEKQFSSPAEPRTVIPVRRAALPFTPLSRRHFILSAATVSAGLCQGLSSALAAEKSSAGAGQSSDAYFDIHMHLAQPWFGPEHGPITASDALRWMDKHGVAQAAVLPLVSPESFWYPISTDFVLSETRLHRDRLIPFCAIDPRTLSTHLTEKRQVLDMLTRYRDAGARGFGEHKPRLPIDDPLCLRLYEACSELKLPVLIHLDNQANMDRPGLPGLARVLESLPELVMIGHGKGWWASIAGNLAQADLHVSYPAGPVAPGGAIDKLMDRFPNLYGDLSSSGAHAILRDPKFGEMFLQRRADRLLFGLDRYDLSQPAFQQFEMFDRIKVSGEVRQKISRGNARRLLGLTA